MDEPLEIHLLVILAPRQQEGRLVVIVMGN
jgi:hypothetical protein